MGSTGFDRQTRESGIELLKIIAIALIVISHVVQTLSTENLYISYQDYVLDLSVATTNLQYMLLIIFRHFGAWGNTIFFVCSAWFLLKSSRCDKKKWFFILIEVWAVSVIILIITYVLSYGAISPKIVIQSLLPTTFANNWYLTCYLLFYPIHPILNGIIRNMGKRALFRLASAMLIIYFGFDFINGGWFFPSEVILWITIYFAVAYMRLYLNDSADNIRYNMILLISGMAGFIGIVICTNFLGLRISFFEDRMLHWAVNCNPFLLAISIAMFNLARNRRFKNRFINYISKLSLLIYIIHENIILRIYYRPYMVNYVYEHYGYGNVITEVFVLAAIICLFSLICAVIYERTAQKLVIKVSSMLYAFVRKIYLKVEQNVLKLH